MKRGLFILFEGLDRSGKSTQSRLLAETLRSRGEAVHQMGFPDRKSPIGQKINEYLQCTTELDDHVIHLLYSANRWEHASDMVARLQSGEHLVVDRYAYSGVAYTSAKGLDVTWCQQPEMGLPLPDLVVYLNVEVDTAANRENYGEERYEKAEFQRKVGEAFKSLADDSWLILDAKQEINCIHEKVTEKFESIRDNVSVEPISLLWSPGHWQTKK